MDIEKLNTSIEVKEILNLHKSVPQSSTVSNPFLLSQNNLLKIQSNQSPENKNYLAFSQMNQRSSGSKRNSMFVGTQGEREQEPVILERHKYDEMSYEYQKIQC